MVGGFFEACALQWKALIGSALVTVLLTLATGLDWLRIPTWFSLAVIAICWLPAPFMAWREERRTMLDLREKLAPRLEMRFLDNTENYFDLRNTPPTYRLFRVGIKNTGGTSVDDVEVKLQNIDPPVWSYGNLPLGSMHHEHGPLNPGAERFFDVVDQSAPGTVRIPHTVSGHPQGIPSTSHTLTLEAYGRNVAPCSGVFVVDFTPSGAGSGPLLVLRRLGNPQ